jgi:hypothetical protein
VDVRLGGGDLLERAAHVDGSRAPAHIRRPRDAALDREVELERSGPEPIAGERARNTSRQTIAGDLDDVARREVEQHDTRLGQLRQ